MNNINLAIFASGAGSNAQNIVNYFADNKNIHVKALLCNNPNAYVLERLEGSVKETIIFTREELQKSEKIEKFLADNQIDLIILAGFLLKIPENIINKFQSRIINIHPALLPKYGGKGMYGMNVHNAVIESHEKVSGITIHLVDEVYDNGKSLFQAECSIDENESAESLAAKIHELEQKHFPRVIEEYIRKLLS